MCSLYYVPFEGSQADFALKKEGGMRRVKVETCPEIPRALSLLYWWQELFYWVIRPSQSRLSVAWFGRWLLSLRNNFMLYQERDNRSERKTEKIPHSITYRVCHEIWIYNLLILTTTCNTLPGISTQAIIIPVRLNVINITDAFFYLLSFFFFLFYSYLAT